MIDEAERCWRYPGIGFRDTLGARRPWIIGTGLDVWELVWILQGFEGNVDKVLDQHHVKRHHIDVARAYYKEFSEEIDEAIAWTQRPLSELEAEFPHIQTMVIEG